MSDTPQADRGRRRQEPTRWDKVVVIGAMVGFYAVVGLLVWFVFFVDHEGTPARTTIVIEDCAEAVGSTRCQGIARAAGQAACGRVESETVRVRWYDANNPRFVRDGSGTIVHADGRAVVAGYGDITHVDVNC